MEEQKIDYLEELSNFIFTSKYARYREDKQRRETWEETVERVLNMHLTKFAYLAPEHIEKIKWAFELVKQKRVVPSMRSAQFGGDAVFAHEARLYNCSAMHVTSLRNFAEFFYLLLCGTGVTGGFSKKAISHLPDLVDEKSKTGTVVAYVVEDTIEGWADSIEALLQCYFRNTPYAGRKIVFDYSRVRPKGAPLKTGGGKAPGHKGLKQAHIKIKKILDYIIEEKKQTRLEPINAYDILMHCADAVLSGGIRRAATMAIFDLDDDAMMKAKVNFKVTKSGGFEKRDDGKWEGFVFVDGINGGFVNNKYDVVLTQYEYELVKNSKEISWVHIEPQRARSNNSVLLMRDQVTREQFTAIVEHTKMYGEPGYLFSNEKMALTNPCVPGDSLVATKDGLKQVDSLIGKSFKALHQGQTYKSTEKGFWSTGIKDTLILNFKSGRKLELTGNHQIQIEDGSWVEAEKLSIGDKVITHNHSSYEHKIDKDSDDFKKGYLAGSFVGDGNYSKGYAQVKFWGRDKEKYHQMVYDYIHSVGWGDKRHKRDSVTKAQSKMINSLGLMNFCEEKKIFDRHSRIKELNKESISGSWSYLSGLLQGYFDADGTVLYNKQKGHSIRLLSVDLQNLEMVQIALSSLGIYSKIYKNRMEAGIRMLPTNKVKGELGEYQCRATHELIIVKGSMKTFYEKVGFGNTDKMQKLKKVLDSYVRSINKQSHTDELESVEKGRTVEVYDCTIPATSSFDVNGVMVHNCAEIGFLPITKDGQYGVAFCNLTSQNGALIKSLDDFLECTEAATIIGTLQAAYTNFPYLSQATEELAKEEALLGVSITGMMDNPDVLLNPRNQYVASQLAVKVNQEWAKLLYINQAARVTCVKPEGSVSLVLKSASGIHPHHARRYFRRVQCNKQDNVYKHFKKFNPKACEESVWSANKTDDIVIFPLTVSESAMLKEDLSAVKHLEIVKSTQENWVIPGTTPVNTRNVAHNVSCTILVDTPEWTDVTNYIFDNRKFFTAVSLLPKSGDKDYQQAPLEKILPQDEDKWNEIVANWKQIDYTTLTEKEDKTTLVQNLSCAGAACEVDFSKDG